MRKKETPLTREEYMAIMQEKRATPPGKEARAFYKKYKKYGIKVFFDDRYPNFRLIISIIAFVASLATFILKIVIG